MTTYNKKNIQKGVYVVVTILLVVSGVFAYTRFYEGFGTKTLHPFEPLHYPQLYDEPGDFVFSIYQILKKSTSCFMNSPDPLNNVVNGISTLDKYKHSITNEETCVLTIGSNTFDVQTDITQPDGKYKTELKDNKGKVLGERRFDLKLVYCSSGYIPCDTTRNVKLYTVIPKELSEDVSRYTRIHLYYQGKELLRGKF